MILQQKMTTVNTNSGPQHISCSSYITVATNSYKTTSSLLWLCKISKPLNSVTPRCIT